MFAVFNRKPNLLNTPLLVTPCYVLEEEKLRRNLALIKSVADEADVEIILAFKAYALWKTFPVFSEYIHSTTASSPYEALMAFRQFKQKAHTYSPAYEENEFERIMMSSSHITFNSLTQYTHFLPIIKKWEQEHDECISLGLRINPEYSEIETNIYNPCAPGSRFGIMVEDMPEPLPKRIEGFHCHNHCESSAEAFSRSLEHIEQKFGNWLDRLKWINFGGGHLMTRKDYNVPLLVSTLQAFRKRHPNLKVILEPGSAFAWQTGSLYADVVDVVENHGIKTAILNVSFTCHMPDCLEMPYWPEIEGAETLPSNEISEEDTRGKHVYRLGGNSCLSGDFMGFWKFKKALKPGDRVIFKDMLHYTTVKTNMFNGIHHPSIVFLRENGLLEYLRQFVYEDYLTRMD